MRRHAARRLRRRARPARTPLEVIEVIGATPLGADLDTDRIAANVQTASAAEIREQGALDLADFMKRNMGSVFVNEAQSNPLQPDVQYRGFVGSPLLGLPQGLAVYQDGVRINEPFGDTVNWALIPESAIDSVYFVPGSNPLFGLNALGGAIAIRTKDGFDHAGTRAELAHGLVRPRRHPGRNGRRVRRRLGYFVTASHLDEDGWRDFSPTEAQQVFAKLDVERRAVALDVSLHARRHGSRRQRRRARRPSRARPRSDLHAARPHPEHADDARSSRGADRVADTSRCAATSTCARATSTR